MKKKDRRALINIPAIINEGFKLNIKIWALLINL